MQVSIITERCPDCRGTGRIYVEYGSSLSYRCPDCDGTGVVAVCSECGATFPAHCSEEGLCESCADKLL